jgi:hypothetical protein
LAPVHVGFVLGHEADAVGFQNRRHLARELLTYKNGVSNVDLVVEHEYPDARIQDPKKLGPVLQGSCAFTKAIDEAAANMIALQKVIESQGIKVQGVGREAYRS